MNTLLIKSKRNPSASSWEKDPIPACLRAPFSLDFSSVFQWLLKRRHFSIRTMVQTLKVQACETTRRARFHLQAKGRQTSSWPDMHGIFQQFKMTTSQRAMPVSFKFLGQNPGQHLRALDKSYLMAKQIVNSVGYFESHASERLQRLTDALCGSRHLVCSLEILMGRKESLCGPSSVFICTCLWLHVQGLGAGRLTAQSAPIRGTWTSSQVTVL